MNIAEFHFIRPYWLLAIMPYLAILVLIVRGKLGQGNWSAVCDADLLPYLLQNKPARQSRWPITVGAIAAMLVIIALAGPAWERLPSPVFRNDSALVIALDLSLSMDAADIKPSRLVLARYKISDILKQRKDGQTALLVYAGDAFTVTPLTDDTETIGSQLSALNTDIMPSQGSNTALALEKAVDLFKQAGLQKGQILLVTDGVEMDKTLAAVKSSDKYALSVLGVGTAAGAPVALPEGGFVKDGQGNIIVPKLNPGELAKLANVGNGIYQTITSDDSDIKNLLATIDKSTQLQGKANDDLLLDQWSDKGPWLLVLALPLAALTFRKGLLCFGLLLILPLPKNSYALGWQDLWQTKDQQAQQAYKNQDYGKAAELFENTDWKAASYYRDGQFEEALNAYEKALSLNPNDADAKYNKTIVEKELEKQKKGEKNDKGQSENDSKQNKDGKPSAKSDEQKKSQEKPGQKQSDKQQSKENQAQQNKDKENGQEAKDTRQASQDKDGDKKPGQKQESVSTQPSDEQQQANEQWLKRIPDDPAGLLKRKFKYQYGQRNRPAKGDAGGW